MATRKTPVGLVSKFSAALAVVCVLLLVLYARSDRHSVEVWVPNLVANLAAIAFTILVVERIVRAEVARASQTRLAPLRGEAERQLSAAIERLLELVAAIGYEPGVSRPEYATELLSNLPERLHPSAIDSPDFALIWDSEQTEFANTLSRLRNLYDPLWSPRLVAAIDAFVDHHGNPSLRYAVAARLKAAVLTTAERADQAQRMRASLKAMLGDAAAVVREFEEQHGTRFTTQRAFAAVDADAEMEARFMGEKP